MGAGGDRVARRDGDPANPPGRALGGGGRGRDLHELGLHGPAPRGRGGIPVGGDRGVVRPHGACRVLGPRARRALQHAGGDRLCGRDGPAGLQSHPLRDQSRHDDHVQDPRCDGPDGDGNLYRRWRRGGRLHQEHAPRQHHALWEPLRVPRGRLHHHVHVHGARQWVPDRNRRLQDERQQRRQRHHR